MRERPDGRYVESEMGEGRCPECGNESENVQYEREGDIQPMPSDYRGECGACGHRDHPIAFHHAYRWERLSDEEREATREAREREEAAQVAWHYSTAGIASRREP